MKADLIKIALGFCCLLTPVAATAQMGHMEDMEDDPLLFSAAVDELEIHDTDDHSLSWEGEAWIGRDLHKLWVKTEGEREDGDGHSDAVETQVLYNRAATPFWDFQTGLRRDSDHGLERNWAVIGFHGTSPYLFEIDTALFIGEDGRSALRFEAEYEIPLTQQLILSPDVELNFHGKDDPVRGIRTGFSNGEAGLRLRYEIRREFAPYVGVNWEKLFGGTADLARFRGLATQDTRLVIGIKAWF